MLNSLGQILELMGVDAVKIETGLDDLLNYFSSIKKKAREAFEVVDWRAWGVYPVLCSGVASR